MLKKFILVISLATIVVSLTKNENELVYTALGSGTNVLREFSKIVANDPDKYSVDLNSLYKKYDIESKANEAKNYLITQVKRGAVYYNEQAKQDLIDSENNLKKIAEIVKKEDPVLGEKLTKFYEKKCELDRITEDIIEYVMDADKVGNLFEDNVLVPLENSLVKLIKKFEILVVEHVPKRGKK